MNNDQKINKWSEKNAVLFLILGIVVLINGRIDLLSLGALISFSSYIHQNSKTLKNLKPLGGYANLMTGIRFLLIVVGSFLFTHISKEWIFGIMGLAVLLDVADGFLARKFNQETRFGQYFDAEVDAFFVLIMCFYFFRFQEVGWWIVVPGLMRYVYKVFTMLVRKEDFVETKKSYAAIIAGTFFVILVACILYEIPYALFIGSIAIILSFSVSFVEYIRY